MEDIADVTCGIATTKKDLNPKVGEPYRMVQIRHVLRNELASPRDFKKVYLRRDREPAKFALKAGDIVVAMLGPNPWVVRVATAPRRCLADNGLGIIRPRSVAAGKRIIKYLTSEKGQERLRSLRSGVALARMALRDLKDVDIPQSRSVV